MRKYTSFVMGTAAAALLSSAALAADPYVPPVVTETPVYAPVTNYFEGAYVGVEGGAYFAGGGAVAGVVDGVIGANFMASESFLLGLEGKIGAAFTSSAVYLDALAMGKAGFVADSILVYGTAGLGSVGSTGVWAAGAGVEFAITDDMSLRGEALYVRDWSSSASVGRATIGALWHF